MAILNYIIWNGSPEIFRMGSVALRWYGLFFALGFLISQQLLYYIFKKEGKPQSDVDTLTIYMVVATIVGARLGHVLFYEPARYFAHPLDILKIWEGGLASHGAAIAILIALWLYSRKGKPGQNYLQTLDRLVILIALTGALIRLGNYFNSEIIGKPTDSSLGVVFVNRLTESIKHNQIDTDKIVDLVGYVKNDTAKVGSNGRKPMLIYIFFKPNATENQIDYLMNEKVRNLLINRFYEFFDQAPELRLTYSIAKTAEGNFAVRLNTFGIARHPAQLYESISCVFLFAFLFWIWNRYKENLPQGRIFGIFLIVCFGLRFLFEYLKENQVGFENDLPLNMGQILSIPLVLAGVIVLIISFRKKSEA